MKILLLAPHPFYQERGTPIAVDLLLQTLAAQGHSLDVLTFHEGEDRTYAPAGAVRLHRIPPPPACRNIRPGFSLKKLRADLSLYRGANRMARDGGYDGVHAVEESVFIAMALKRKFGIPYIYDMDSSLPVQMADAWWGFRLFLPVLRAFERRAIRGAQAIAAVCDALADLARAEGARHVVLLRDVPLSVSDPSASNAGMRGIREELGITGLCVLYIGNLERYQGMDLLLRGFALCSGEIDAHLVIIGGVPAHIEQYRARAKELGIAARVHLPGPRPVSRMNALLAEADILVSPRTQGQNTPMKIYSYMAAGKAILATDLPTHTQVLSSETAQLSAPEPEPFSDALRELARDSSLREALGREARHVVETRYSREVFRRSVADLYAGVKADAAPAGARRSAPRASRP